EEKFFGVERKREHFPRAGLQGFEAIGFGGVARRDHQDRRRRCDEALLAQRAAHRPAILIGEPQIEDDDVGLARVRALQHFLPVVRAKHGVSVGTQDALDGPDRPLLVATDERKRGSACGRRRRHQYILCSRAGTRYRAFLLRTTMHESCAREAKCKSFSNNSLWHKAAVRFRRMRCTYTTRPPAN